MLDFVQQAVRAARSRHREGDLSAVARNRSVPTSSGRSCLARCRFRSEGTSWKRLVFAASR